MLPIVVTLIVGVVMAFVSRCYVAKYYGWRKMGTSPVYENGIVQMHVAIGCVFLALGVSMLVIEHYPGINVLVNGCLFAVSSMAGCWFATAMKDTVKARHKHR